MLYDIPPFCEEFICVEQMFILQTISMNISIRHLISSLLVEASLFASLFSLSSCDKQHKEEEVQGIFEAESILVSSYIDGRVEVMKAEEGLSIKEGDTLAKIDDKMMIYQKEYIQQQQKTAQNSGILSAPLQTKALDIQISSLKNEIKKVTRLVEKGILSESKLTSLKTNLATLEAQKQSSIQKIEKQNNSTQGSSEALNSQLSQVKELIARSAVLAPINGTILTIYVHKGELTAAGRPLLKMADLSYLTLRIYLNSEQLNRLKIGDNVVVYNDMGEKETHPYEGVVSWISEEAEFTPKNIQTSSMRSTLIYSAKVKVKNDGYLKIGQYGKVILPVKNDNSQS